ncbi:MAG: hypothetical protein KUG67_02565 [Proteobacteria bacterium]|nr:hypothetical protein [Pseudomonadota bacterium]
MCIRDRQYREIIPSKHLPIAKVLRSGNEHAVDVAAVIDMVVGDPNVAFEALYDVAADRLPLKWIPNELAPEDNVKLLQVDGTDPLSDIDLVATPLETALRVFNLDLPLTQWGALGGKEFNIHTAICAGGGSSPITVVDMPDLFAQAATADVNQIFNASYTPTPMLWDTGTITWTKVNSNPDPYICLRPRPYEKFTAAALWGSHLVAQYGGPFIISAGAYVFDLTGAEPEDFTFLRPATWTGFARSRAAYLAPPTSGIVGLRVWMEEPSLTSFTLTMPLVLTDPIGDLQAWYAAHRQDSLILNSAQTSVGYSSALAAISVATDYSSLRSVTRQTVGSLTSCDVRVTAYSMGAPSVGKSDEGNRCYRPASEAASGSTTPMASMASQNILGDLLQQQACLISTTNGVATTQRFLGAQFEFDPMKVSA